MISVNKTGGKWQTFWVELFHLFNLLFKLKHTSPVTSTSAPVIITMVIYTMVFGILYNHLPGRSWSIFVNVDLVQVLLLKNNNKNIVDNLVTTLCVHLVREFHVPLSILNFEQTSTRCGTPVPRDT